MILSTTILQQPEREPLTAKTLRALLESCHDDTPIMVKIGDTLCNIREWRQVTNVAVSNNVMKVIVPVDPVLITK